MRFLNEQYQELGAQNLICFVWATTGGAGTIALFFKSQFLQEAQVPSQVLQHLLSSLSQQLFQSEVPDCYVCMKLPGKS